jgi:transcriptional regulator with XRE-family HTH domain
MRDRLRAIQARETLNDREMAARLGVARSTWTEIKNGRLAVSEAVQMRAVRAFPELLADHVMSLSQSPIVETA